MRTYRYTGLFQSAEGHEFELEVNTTGFICAFFLLTADAIRAGRHYQLHTITDEEGFQVQVGDILQVNELLK